MISSKDMRKLRAAVRAMGPTGLRITRDGEYRQGLKGEVVPVDGAQVTFTTGTPSQRVTATRAVALGLFALGAKKNTTKLYVSIEGTSASMLVEVQAKYEAAVHRFVQLANQM